MAANHITSLHLLSAPCRSLQMLLSRIRVGGLCHFTNSLTQTAQLHFSICSSSNPQSSALGDIHGRDVSIGDVTVRLSETLILPTHSTDASAHTLGTGPQSVGPPSPARLDLIPTLEDESMLNSNDMLQLLRWLMQKSLLKQDVFIIGPPDATRRQAALYFCQITEKECQYLAISNDTTEADLKQRAEISAGSLKYVDQPPVTCALNGRVLIIDGIEKAERNVLPTLNNLLENREMSLDDGRLLMSPARYDQLLQQHSRAELDAKKIVRVHPDFQVIALGMPVPAYPGFSLDPPLRSRFQSYAVAPADPDARLAALCDKHPDVPAAALRSLVSFVSIVRDTHTARQAPPRVHGTLHGEERPQTALSLPYVSEVALDAAARRMDTAMRWLLAALPADGHAERLRVQLLPYIATESSFVTVPSLSELLGELMPAADVDSALHRLCQAAAATLVRDSLCHSLLPFTGLGAPQLGAAVEALRVAGVPTGELVVSLRDLAGRAVDTAAANTELSLVGVSALSLDRSMPQPHIAFTLPIADAAAALRVSVEVLARAAQPQGSTPSAPAYLRLLCPLPSSVTMEGEVAGAGPSSLLTHARHDAFLAAMALDLDLSPIRSAPSARAPIDKHTEPVDGANVAETAEVDVMMLEEYFARPVPSLETPPPSLCVLGQQGGGKSVLVRQLAALLGRETALRYLYLYKDMSARDLVQRRVAKGTDTAWEDSDLIVAAKFGSICVLDGLDRLPAATVSVLRSLLNDRFLSLSDGSRLMGPVAFERARARLVFQRALQLWGRAEAVSPPQLDELMDAPALAALRGLLPPALPPVLLAHAVRDVCVLMRAGGAVDADANLSELLASTSAADSCLALRCPDDSFIYRVHDGFRVVALAEAPRAGALHYGLVSRDGKPIDAGAASTAARALVAEAAPTGTPTAQIAAGAKVLARCVAALPPAQASSPTAPWLTDETASMFLFHALPPLSLADLLRVVAHKHPALSPAAVHIIGTATLRLAAALANQPLRSTSPAEAKTRADAPATATLLDALVVQPLHADVRADALSAALEPFASVPAASLSLSLRNLLRVAAIVERFPADLSHTLRRVVLAPFLPVAARERVRDALATVDTDVSQALAAGKWVPLTTSAEAGPTTDAQLDADVPAALPPSVSVAGGMLTIGKTTYPRARPSRPELVPRPSFFFMPAHERVLEEMLRDYASGVRHMLLIGNQGVGKNKLADMFCQLLLLEREYMQLHRDTTVSSLLQTPVLTAGAIAYVPSPLATAAVEGRMCVVDEADKAGAEVVGVLRGLVEDGELLLPDGTRIVDFTRYPQWREKHERSLALGLQPSVLPLHPSFRLLVLANRPGFPFLGNDLFRACGDVLSLHIVEAPDVQSELQLVRAYAPAVDSLVLNRLVKVFAWLRAAAEEGRVVYPYSTRELVNIARHLQEFPHDSVQSAVRNTVAFDFWNSKVLALLCEGFTKHGIPMDPDTLRAQAPSSVATRKALRDSGCSVAQASTVDAEVVGRLSALRGELKGDFGINCSGLTSGGVGRAKGTSPSHSNTAIHAPAALRCVVHKLAENCRGWANEFERLPSTAQADTETQQHVSFLARAADDDTRADDEKESNARLSRAITTLCSVPPALPAGTHARTHASSASGGKGAGVLQRLTQGFRKRASDGKQSQPQEETVGTIADSSLLPSLRAHFTQLMAHTLSGVLTRASLVYNYNARARTPTTLSSKHSLNDAHDSQYGYGYGYGGHGGALRQRSLLSTAATLLPRLYAFTEERLRMPIDGFQGHFARELAPHHCQHLLPAYAHWGHPATAVTPVADAAQPADSAVLPPARPRWLCHLPFDVLCVFTPSPPALTLVAPSVITTADALRSSLTGDADAGADADPLLSLPSEAPTHVYSLPLQGLLRLPRTDALTALAEVTVTALTQPAGAVRGGTDPAGMVSVCVSHAPTGQSLVVDIDVRHVLAGIAQPVTQGAQVKPSPQLSARSAAEGYTDAALELLTPPRDATAATAPASLPARVWSLPCAVALNSADLFDGLRAQLPQRTHSLAQALSAHLTTLVPAQGPSAQTTVGALRALVARQPAQWEVERRFMELAAQPHVQAAAGALQQLLGVRVLEAAGVAADDPDDACLSVAMVLQRLNTDSLAPPAVAPCGLRRGVVGAEAVGVSALHDSRFIYVRDVAGATPGHVDTLVLTLTGAGAAASITAVTALPHGLLVHTSQGVYLLKPDAGTSPQSLPTSPRAYVAMLRQCCTCVPVAVDTSTGPRSWQAVGAPGFTSSIIGGHMPAAEDQPASLISLVDSRSGACVAVPVPAPAALPLNILSQPLPRHAHTQPAAGLPCAEEDAAAARALTEVLGGLHHVWRRHAAWCANMATRGVAAIDDAANAFPRVAGPSPIADTLRRAAAAWRAVAACVSSRDALRAYEPVLSQYTHASPFLPLASSDAVAAETLEEAVQRRAISAADELPILPLFILTHVDRADATVLTHREHDSAVGTTPASRVAVPCLFEFTHDAYVRALAQSSGVLSEALAYAASATRDALAQALEAGVADASLERLAQLAADAEDPPTSLQLSAQPVFPLAVHALAVLETGDRAADASADDVVVRAVQGAGLYGAAASAAAPTPTHVPAALRFVPIGTSVAPGASLGDQAASSGHGCVVIREGNDPSAPTSTTPLVHWHNAALQCLQALPLAMPLAAAPLALAPLSHSPELSVLHADGTVRVYSLDQRVCEREARAWLSMVTYDHPRVALYTHGRITTQPAREAREIAAGGVRATGQLQVRTTPRGSMQVVRRTGRNEVLRERARAPNKPKHGKIDPTGAAHHGGGSWHGGSGGADTAGLGGRGGPYRVDRGHDIHQVSDEAKASVSAETQRAARELGVRAWEERLREIGMDAGEVGEFLSLRARVLPFVGEISSIINALPSTSRERVWHRHQPRGDLDDTMLVDAVTGGSHIYRRRLPPSAHSPVPPRRRRLVLVVDMSASMFRFDGVDGRLTRLCEVTVGVCEAVRQAGPEWSLGVFGHSGEGKWLPLVPEGARLNNERDLVRLARTMRTHAQFCLSGDNSLPAYRAAIRYALQPPPPLHAAGTGTDSAQWQPDPGNWRGAGGALGVATEEADGDFTALASADGEAEDADTLVLFVTDANLRRYGIAPERVGRVCEDGWRAGVKNYCVLISRDGAETEAVRRACPPGKAMVVEQGDELARTFRHILSDLQQTRSDQ